MNKKRNPILAFLFSLCPPMGQVYNGQIKKGIILYLIGIIVPIIMLILKIPQTLPGLIIIAIFGISFYIFMIIDAILNAIKQKDYELKKYNRWYFYIIGVLILLFIFSPAVEYLVFNIIGTARAFSFPSGSMEPTIIVGDRLIADMSYYRSHKPQRSDLLVFEPPFDKEKYYIKRCVAIENDDVEFKNGFLYINGKKQNESYAQGKTIYHDTIIKGTNISGKVPANNILVLGDNRENSMDSRQFGYMPLENIKGKPLFIYYSPDTKRIGKVIK
jgi:signal peptidase I